MQSELLAVGRRLSEDPKAVKRLKPMRGAGSLAPGVYYNHGTGMVERIYAPQQMALGNRVFRISKDPDAPVEEIEQRVQGGWIFNG